MIKEASRSSLWRRFTFVKPCILMRKLTFRAVIYQRKHPLLYLSISLTSNMLSFLLDDHLLSPPCKVHQSLTSCPGHSSPLGFLAHSQMSTRLFQKALPCGMGRYTEGLSVNGRKLKFIQEASEHHLCSPMQSISGLLRKSDDSHWDPSTYQNWGRAILKQWV